MPVLRVSRASSPLMKNLKKDSTLHAVDSTDNTAKRRLSQFFLARATGTLAGRATQAEEVWLRRLATALAIKAATTYTWPATSADVNVLHRPIREIARSGEPTRCRQLI